MANRSTRKKILDHMDRAIADFDKAMEHLQNLHGLADGRSEFINKHLPGIIVGMDGLRIVLQQYREML